MALADGVVLAAVFKSESIPVGERLVRRRWWRRCGRAGVESAVYADADAIVAALCRSFGRGMWWRFLSNGGFGGIYEKLPRAIAGYAASAVSSRRFVMVRCGILQSSMFATLKAGFRLSSRWVLLPALWGFPIRF